MIEVEPRLLKFLRAGRTIELDASRPYAKGKAITVAVVGEQRGKLRVQVLEAAAHEDGWRLTVRQHSREEIWYLTANPGAQRADYTQNPSRAAREPSGAAIEAQRDSTPPRALPAPQTTAERRRREIRSAAIQLKDAARREDWPAYGQIVRRLDELGGSAGAV